MTTSSNLTISTPLPTDPDIPVGGQLTLERADGRPVWRTQLTCINRWVDQWGVVHYYMRPIE